MTSTSQARASSWYLRGENAGCKRSRTAIPNTDTALEAISAKDKLAPGDVAVVAACIGQGTIEHKSRLFTDLVQRVAREDLLRFLCLRCSVQGPVAHEGFVEGFVALCQSLPYQLLETIVDIPLGRRALFTFQGGKQSLTPQNVMEAVNSQSPNLIKRVMISWLCGEESSDSMLYVDVLRRSFPLALLEEALSSEEFRCFPNEVLHLLNISSLMAISQKSPSCKSSLMQMIERLIKRASAPCIDFAKALFSALQDTCLQDDIVEGTTPRRQKARVEAWRRLGERMARNMVRQSGQNPSQSQRQLVFDIWVAGLSGVIALNTSAACIGCLFPRQHLSIAAMDISTQPDEEGLVPVSILTAIVRFIIKKSTLQSPADLRILTALATCAKVAQCFSNPEHILKAPTDVMDDLQKTLNVAKLKIETAPLSLKLAVLLLADPVVSSTTTAIREIIYESGEVEDIGCALLRILFSQGDNLVLKEASLEARLVTKHITEVGHRGCPQCHGNGDHIDVLWKVTQIFRYTAMTAVNSSNIPNNGQLSQTYGDQMMNNLIQLLEQRGSQENLHSSLFTTTITRLAKFASIACPSVTLLEQDARRANQYMRLLGALCYCSGTARSAIIETLDWRWLLSIGSGIGGQTLGPRALAVVRTNSLVLARELITKCSVTLAPSSGMHPKTTMVNSMFTSRKDDVVLVEIDKKLDLTRSIISLGVLSTDGVSLHRTAPLCLEIGAKMMEHYRSAAVGVGGTEDLKKRMALFTLDVLFALHTDAALRHLLDREDPLRRATGSFVASAIHTCPVLHQLQTLPPTKELMRRRSALEFCSRWAAPQVNMRVRQTLNL